MNKNFAPEKYGMVICPVCSGKGFLNRDNISVRGVCTKCGGFGAIKKEEETFRGLGNENPVMKRKLT